MDEERRDVGVKMTERVSNEPEKYRARLYDHYLVPGPHNSVSNLRVLGSRAPYVRELVRRHFPSDRHTRILDLGCGDGFLIRIARSMGYGNIWGVDRSVDQVARASAAGIPNVMQGELSATLQGLPDGSQDVVIVFDVLEHFRRDEEIEILEGVRRVLTEAGYCIIHVPNAESPFFGRIRYGDLTHEQAFTVGSLKQLLSACGFGTVRCYEDVPIVHGAKSAVRFVMWKVIRGALRLYLAAETGSIDPDCILSQNVLAVARR